MCNVQQNRMDAIREGAERIRESNLLSDTFVSVALEEPAACQHVLRKILKKKDLKVVWVKGQYRLLNLTAKDSVLDIFAEDSDGHLMNVEIQRKDTVDHARRTRYYSSMIDKSNLDKGLDYDQLPDVYIIYISETDLWGAGKTVYTVEKTLGKSNLSYDDGSHVIYVNAEVNDGSEIAKMMSYFKTADPTDMSQGDLSVRVRFLKTEQGGSETMSEVSEWLFSQGKQEGKKQEKEAAIRRMLQDGRLPVEKIADYQNASVETVRRIKEEMLQKA